jgi:prepilin-type processing-associated H-X9-DG protein/prepilin-type N-terminal cleavage/methylation domain-containing protein
MGGQKFNRWKVVRRHGGTGFTLVELLVVIGVVSLLAALLLPTLSLAKSYGRSASCKNHLHQLGMALKMYADDHHSTFPYYLGPAGPSYGDELGQKGKAVGLVYWSSKLIPYYPLNWTNHLFHCPGYKGAITGPTSDPGSAERYGSYAYNIWGSAGHPLTISTFGLGPILYWNVPPVAESQITLPSDMLSIGESRFLTTNAVSVPGGTVRGGAGGGDAMQCGNSLDLFDPARHGKNYNQLFCDGHVSSLSPWVLFNPTNTASMWNYDHEPHPELWW